MWFEGGATIENPTDGMANDDAAVALWHCAQFVLVEGALAWISAIDGITAKSVLVWQDVHVAEVETGIWLAGIPLALKSLKLP